MTETIHFFQLHPPLLRPIVGFESAQLSQTKPYSSTLGSKQDPLTVNVFSYLALLAHLSAGECQLVANCIDARQRETPTLEPFAARGS